MKKKQKGFTLVEVIVTFCLVSTISFLLFQIVLSLKELYTSSDYRTVLLIEQGNMTRRFNEDMFDLRLKELKSCDEDTKSDDSTTCLLFVFYDEVTSELLDAKKLEVFDDKIVYDSYTMTLQNGSSIDSENISIAASSLNDDTMLYNSILKIDIPVVNKLTDGDFGLHAIIQYNRQFAIIDANVLNVTEIASTSS